MRRFVEGLFIFIFAFLSVRAGLPWPIVFIVGVLSLCGARVFSFARNQRINPNVFATLALFFGIGLLISWWIAEYLSSVVPTIVASGSTPPLVRWFPDFFLGTESATVFWSLVLGLGISAAIVWIILQLAGSVAAPLIYGSYDQYKGYESEARHSVFMSLLGRSNGTQLVSAGSATPVSGDAATLEHFGGPGTLIVQEGHAVILEKGGGFSRIVTQGITSLDPFERISMVVPLYPRKDSITVEQVATKDRILIEEFDVLVFHKVDPGPEEEQVKVGRAAYNKDILINTVWKPGGADPRGSVRSMTESAVRDVVGRYDLEEILPIAGDFRGSFKQELMREINKITKTLMGVEVKSVDIGKVKIPEEAEKRLQAKWLADRDVQIAESEKLTSVTQGEAEMARLRLKELTRAESQTRMMAAITEGIRQIRERGGDPQELIAMRFIEALEKMSEDPATKVFLPNSISEIVEQFAKPTTEP